MQKNINPFINNLVVPYTLVVKSPKANEDGSLDTYEYENEPYIRVYSNKARREFVYTLSMYARDMLMAIQYFTHSENHYVILTFEKMSTLYKDTKYGKRRYDDTVRELIRNAIIDYKDKDKHQYWYNPAYFAPTNRLTMFPECKLKTHTIQKF